MAEDGQTKKAKILRGVSPAIDKEALRVVSSMPKLEPAKQNGKAVSMTLTLPIDFRLN